MRVARFRPRSTRRLPAATSVPLGPSPAARRQPFQRRRPLRAADHRPRPSRIDVGAVKLPRRDVSPHLGGRRHPHPVRRGPGARRAVFGHQQPPRPERVGAGTRCSITAGISASSTCPVRPRRRCGTLRCAAATVGSGRHEIRSVVVGAQQRGQHRRTPPHRCPTPRIRRCRARAADPCRDGAGGQQAGPPDCAVAGELEARVARTAAQREQGEPGAGDAGKVTVRVLLTICSRRPPQLLDLDDHRFGGLPARRPDCD